MADYRPVTPLGLDAHDHDDELGQTTCTLSGQTSANDNYNQEHRASHDTLLAHVMLDNDHLTADPDINETIGNGLQDHGPDRRDSSDDGSVSITPHQYASRSSRLLLQPVPSSASFTSDQSGIPLMPLSTDLSQDQSAEQTTNERSKPTTKTSLRKRFSGWRFGVLASACAAIATCLVNIILTIWLVATNPPADGIGTALIGPCSSVSNVALGAHLLINSLSSILLAASNYCMQCLAAPTRSECDRAHMRNDYMDIGFSSAGNLFKIGTFRAILWITLAVTSLPIHLVYNSAIFKALTVREYNIVAVNPEFLSYEGSRPKARGCTVQNDIFSRSLNETTNSTDYLSLMAQVNSSCHTSNCHLPPGQIGHNTTNGLTLWYINDVCQNTTRCTQTDAKNNTKLLDLTHGLTQPWPLWTSCRFSDCSLTVGNHSTAQPTYQDIAVGCSSFVDKSEWVRIWDNGTETLARWAVVESAKAELAVAQPRHRYFNNTGSYSKLSLDQCVKNYAQDFATEWGDVFLVSPNYYRGIPSSELPMISTIPAVFGYAKSTEWYEHMLTDAQVLTYHWLCGIFDQSNATLSEGFCDSRYGSLAYSWLSELQTEYCMAENFPSTCKIQYSPVMLAIVIVCNALKAVCMILTIMVKRNAPLAVTGDALASYLHRPDESTKDQCLARKALLSSHQEPQSHQKPWWQMQTREEALAMTTGRQVSAPAAAQLGIQPKSLPRLYKAVHGSQLLCAIVFIGAFIIATIIFLSMAIQSASFFLGKSESMWMLGLGAVSSRLTFSRRGNSSLSSTEAFINAVVVSNLPQLVLSVAYLLYNNLLTVMLQYREWSEFGLTAKPLRVTSPEGMQRSTYFLHLPYKYGIPLLVSSAILHWLVSASLFLVQVDAYDQYGAETPKLNLTAIGYSPLAILLSLLLGICILFGALGIGNMHAKSHIPIAPSNSFAIAANCHPPPGDVNAALQLVRWGETEFSPETDIGYCTFTSFPVTDIRSGRLYQ